MVLRLREVLEPMAAVAILILICRIRNQRRINNMVFMQVVDNKLLLVLLRQEQVDSSVQHHMEAVAILMLVSITRQLCNNSKKSTPTSRLRVDCIVQCVNNHLRVNLT